MATVVLLGYSCAGKSFIADRVVKRWSEVEKLDSDQWVSKPYGKHIYEVFFRLGRRAALETIAQREGELLDSLLPTEGPRLIAAGPSLPSRVQWNAFVERVQPMFVYFELTPEEELERLFERRAKHTREPEVGGHELFGSWDQGLTTKMQEDGTWVQVDDTVAFENIRAEMAPLVFLYEQHADVEHRYSLADRSGPNEARVIERIGHLLGLG